MTELLSQSISSEQVCNRTASLCDSLGVIASLTHLEVELQDVLDDGIWREAAIFSHEVGQGVVTVDGGSGSQEQGIVELQQFVATHFL